MIAEPPFRDEGEALAAVAAAVSAINGVWTNDAGLVMGREQRISELLNGLYGLCERVAAQFAADGFSVSVGLPLGLSVTFDFSRRDRRGVERLLRAD